MTGLRLVLADDHAVLRQSLAALIERQDDMSVVGQASSGGEAVELVERTLPDVAVLDLSMPNGGGIAAIETLRERGATVRCLVLSMHENPSALRRVVAVGGDGYVTKRASAQELLEAIRRVGAGGAYFSVTETGEQPLPSNERVAELSPREREVFRQVALGHTSKEIAAHLEIQHSTVDVYRSRLMRKLGLTSRAELVQLALAAGVLAV